MDFSTYSKKFVDMQNDYLKLDKIRKRLVESKVLSSVMEEKKQEYEDLNKTFQFLNQKVEKEIIDVKNDFVENNEMLDYSNFKTSLTFFNSYSAFENVKLLDESDYEKLNKEMLTKYRDEIKTLVSKKEKQMNNANENLEENREKYKSEFKNEPEDNKSKKQNRERIMSIRYEKVKREKDNIQRQAQSLKNELKMIDSALIDSQN